ncbi:hypothetical protein WA026_012124 [Henosepilachna vigintioctopunctata]|uniref:G-protein coupled receptors family 1 profile domain-containing protein n=1 Tax=Henosepilachna vigintioctopunctata TaxID=420089 RepID=A0AAW1V689_9CUCU
MDVPILLGVTAGVVANCIITYIILRNKSLRVRSNIYIVNFCICNILYLIFTPLILNLFSAAERIHVSVICYSDEIFFLFMFGDYLFICIILLDWYIVTYKSLRTSARCRASYKLVIVSVWTIIIVLMLTIILQCSTGVSLFAFIAAIAILSYFITLILIVFISIMKFINERTTSIIEVKTNLPLIYVLTYFLCWLPNCLYIVIISVFNLHGLVAFALGTFVIGYTYSPILLVIMYKRDEKFGKALRKSLCNVEPENSEENHVNGDEHLTTLI